MDSSILAVTVFGALAVAPPALSLAYVRSKTRRAPTYFALAAVFLIANYLFASAVDMNPHTTVVLLKRLAFGAVPRDWGDVWFASFPVSTILVLSAPILRHVIRKRA